MKLYRPATVLVGILFVLLGGLTRLADPANVYDDATRVVKHGTIGEALPFGGSTVAVDRVKFARSYLSDEGSDSKSIESGGIFVAIEYDTVQGTEPTPGRELQLSTNEGTVYEPISDTYGSQLDFAAPGFGVTGAVLFEVNPADVEELTLRVRTSQLYNVLAQDVTVDLGIPDEKIAQRLIDAAAPEYLIPRSITRVAS
ncbi:hypothetical protein [Streptomyces sp. SID13031]|uniref:hypothetical protein n=1 Tax=Streptomyces sp. SID13031 TaxID=2706046 RepID=UPI0013CA1C52|nr:hypothetical protein [Streptomyces sp. SID13031]NEA33338.1 hypothetical protein [Streptomyces sp. SID13031]